MAKKQKLKPTKAGPDRSLALDWIATYWDRYLLLRLRCVSKFFWKRFVDDFPFPFGAPNQADLIFLRHPKALTRLSRQPEFTRRLDFLAARGANVASVLVLETRSKRWTLQRFDPEVERHMNQRPRKPELPRLPWDYQFRIGAWEAGNNQGKIGSIEVFISRAMRRDNAKLLFASLSYYFAMKRYRISNLGLPIAYETGAPFPRKCLIMINRIEVARTMDMRAFLDHAEARAFRFSTGHPILVSSDYHFVMNARELSWNPGPLSDYPWKSPFYRMGLPWELVRTHKDFILVMKTYEIIHRIPRPVPEETRLFFAKRYLKIFHTKTKLRRLREMLNLRLSQIQRYLQTSIGRAEFPAVQQLAYVQAASGRRMGQLFPRVLIMEHTEGTFDGQEYRYVNFCRTYAAITEPRQYKSHFASFAMACLAAKLEPRLEPAVLTDILHKASIHLVGVDLTPFVAWAQQRNWTVPVFDPDPPPLTAPAAAPWTPPAPLL